MATMLALISLALAILVVLLSRLPRRVLVLLVSSVVGVFIAWVTFVTNSMRVECDYSNPPRVDTCSGLYVSLFGEHRLPQFMQGDHADAWLIFAAGLIGATVACLVALLSIWGWSRFRRGRPVASAA